jgi:hypothetical protein
LQYPDDFVSIEETSISLKSKKWTLPRRFISLNIKNGPYTLFFSLFERTFNIHVRVIVCLLFFSFLFFSFLFFSNNGRFFFRLCTRTNELKPA